MYESVYNELKNLNAYNIIDDYIESNENAILNLVRKRMKQGIGVNGGNIGTYASLSYSYFKQSYNPLAGGYVDLYLTGALHKSLEINKYGTGYFVITASDSKYFSLAEKYGEEQFGLTDDEHNKVKEESVKEVINQISKCYE